jgi:hypothetical protein
VQRIEHAIGRVHLHVVVDPARLVIDLGVEAPDDESDGERLEAGLDGRVSGLCAYSALSFLNQRQPLVPTTATATTAMAR